MPSNGDQLKLNLKPKRTGDLASQGSKPTRHLVAGLFAGIGGIERGLARAGHEAALLCENDPGAMAVLTARFPRIPLHDDIHTLQKLPQGVTLVAAGFPCQDLSQAGKTAGIRGKRSRLVDEVFRLIERHKTSWVLLENVPFMLQLAGGRAMDVIASTLEDLNYHWAYRVVDSRAFGLPQRRRRVYLVASRAGDPRSVLFADDAEPLANHADLRKVACGFYWTEGVRGLGWATDAVPTLKGGSTVGIPSSPAIIFPDGRVCLPSILDAERLQGFPRDWTKPSSSVARSGHRWKLVGNAVTVQAAEWIGRRLAKPGVSLDFPVSSLRRIRAWPTAAYNVGSGRVHVAASEWPVRRKYQSLAAFLRYEPVPLSAKATAGFLARAERGGLRFPPEFLASLRAHLERMRGEAKSPKDVRSAA